MSVVMPVNRIMIVQDQIIVFNKPVNYRVKSLIFPLENIVPIRKSKREFFFFEDWLGVADKSLVIVVWLV